MTCGDAGWLHLMQGCGIRFRCVKRRGEASDAGGGGPPARGCSQDTYQDVPSHPPASANDSGRSASEHYPADAPPCSNSPPRSPLPSSPNSSTSPPEPPPGGPETQEETGPATPPNWPGNAVTRCDE